MNASCWLFGRPGTADDEQNRNWVKAAVRPNRKCDSNVQAPFHRLRITKRSQRSRAYHFSFCALSPPSKDLLNSPKRFPDITNPSSLSLYLLKFHFHFRFQAAQKTLVFRVLAFYGAEEIRSQQEQQLIRDYACHRRNKALCASDNKIC